MPDPVAKDDGASGSVLIPIKVGKVSTTPIPLIAIPMTIRLVFGTRPMALSRVLHAIEDHFLDSGLRRNDGHHCSSIR